MLICADHIIDSATNEPLKIYHGDFPIIINSDDIFEMFVAAGVYFNDNDKSYFFAAARTKDKNLYRISDIYEIPNNYNKILDGANPRGRAKSDLFDILKELDDGKPYCRKVFLSSGNDRKHLKNIRGGNDFGSTGP